MSPITCFLQEAEWGEQPQADRVPFGKRADRAGSAFRDF